MKVRVNDNKVLDLELDQYEKIITNTIDDDRIIISVPRITKDEYEIKLTIHEDISMSISVEEYKRAVVIIYAALSIISKDLLEKDSHITLKMEWNDPSPFSHRVITSYFTLHGWLKLFNGETTIIDDKVECLIEHMSDCLALHWKQSYIFHFHEMEDKFLEELSLTNTD